MPDKLKEKYKSVFGILVMVVAGGLGYFAVKEVKKQWFQSEAIEKASESAAVSMEQDIKLAQSQATTEKNTSTILLEEARKSATSTLNTTSTYKQKLEAASNMFFGAYLLNTRTRPDYCASLGIPIKSFVSTYKQKHHQLFTTAERIQIQDFADHGYTYNIDKLYKMMSPSHEKVIVQDMKDVASNLEISEREVCQSFEQNSTEWVDLFDLRKIVPEITKILLSAE